MNLQLPSPPVVQKPTRARYGVLGFACALSMITYLDRVCFGTVAPYVQKEFGLSPDQVGLLFTAFALAYAAFEIPSGWLGDVFGPRRTLVRIVLWWSAFTALTGCVYPVAGWPWFAFAAMLLVRFLFGVGEAGAYPNIARALHNWFPFGERGSAQGAVWMAGRLVGGLSPFAVLILLYTTPTPHGATVTHWRHAFWAFGGLGVVWCLLFWWWFRDRPEQHPGVNAAELAQIRGATPPAPPGPEPARAPDPRTAVITEAVRVGVQPKGPPPAARRADEPAHADVPWRKLLTSGNLWVLCLMYFCAAYGWYFNITWLPGYLGTQFGVSRETHGLWATSFLAGGPLLIGAPACLVGGLLTDAFIRRTGDRKWGRRLFGMLGHGLCALCYFLSLLAPNPWLFVLAVALAAFCNDLTMGSAWASCLDIGGRYSGIVSGCMNTVGNLGGALAGYSAGWVVKQWPQTGWTINLMSFAVAYVLAVLFWLAFDATRPVAPEAVRGE
jgi:MFS transporter, ACS family, glucarate transporter